MNESMSINSLIRVPYTPVDVAVTDMDNSAWKQSRPIHLTHYWSGIPAPTCRQAEASIVWTERALCVRFLCQQNEPLVISETPQTVEKTLGLWDRDVCEIFIAPDPAVPNSYFEFEAAPTGEWVDLAIMKTAGGRETEFDFKSGMSAAAIIAADQIQISMRIPWSERIPDPQPNTKWRVNLFRCVGSDPDRGYVTWRPTYTPEPSFHAPEAFGWLLFADE
jgi:Carbohydrate family 9 binding domain-like